MSLDLARPANPAQQPSEFAADVVAGLSAHPKALPPKYFYDATGSRLFEEITRQPEYYPTRAELNILTMYRAEIAQFVPDKAALIEFGSGSAQKFRKIVGAAPHVAAYVPVDISAAYLKDEAARFQRDFPAIAVHPIEADFTRRFALPPAIRNLPRVGLFPGSTIGNFEPADAKDFLRQAAWTLGPNSAFIVGVDLDKDAATLHRAYNDAAGVTARFNLNLLNRINRELGADFDLTGFEHLAFYNEERHRIEMHLVSRRGQTVHVCGQAFRFAPAESIRTENSYKYSLDAFEALARESGWTYAGALTDPRKRFSVHFLAQD